MSSFLVYMRRIIGEKAANATAARNTLSSVAGKLSPSGDGDGDDLHRRCVLFDCAPSRVRADAVCAALAPSYGDIEAVAICGHYGAAVVVFRTAAAAETALRGPARRSCHAVPPLDLGVENPDIGPTEVKIMPDLPDLELCAPPPPPEAEEEEEPSPWFEFRDRWAEANGAVPPLGARRFRPSCESLVHGPTRGADGSLWMVGKISSTDQRGKIVGLQYGASVRVKRTDPPPKDKRRRGIPDTAIWFETY